MERQKNRFLEELAKGLGNHQDKEEILLEYEAHIDEILSESYDCFNEDEVMTRIVSRLGSPEEITELWREELSVTPSNMKWLFILLNILFFGGGSLLTLAHNLFQWEWIASIWSYLTAIPTLIAFLYMFFWALLGYEIGRGFGHGGRRLLRKTFLLSLIPNLILMFLTVFHIIPHSWFAPLLTKTFIIACIIFTIFLYPISWIGYRWGRKASI
ncbi:HAAS signaling domain-containing protein [Neobacillus sp. NPDC097160]|uniref:HAAS signaling domain-containing protein n=1 Tax=Neobacillus sp. NPDC097160 TaxID=3364298 RepID=UPI003827161F